MRAGEFIFRLLSERVVPDNPVSTDHLQHIFSDYFHLCRVIVADSDIKRAGRFKGIAAGRHPLSCPVDIVLFFFLVVVFVVFVADVKRGVCENKVCKRRFNSV
jgi:hypothetical protein